MTQVAMLWVGSELSGIQQLSMRSFLYHGHSVTLFVYDPIKAPDGVEIMDGSLIMPREAIFQSHETFSAFSDVFRYQLLAVSNYLWADADTICLRPDWNFDEYVFSYGEPYKLTNSVLSYPQESLLAKTLQEEAIFQEGKAYDELGPVLLTKVVAELGLGGYALPQDTFNPIDWSDYSWVYTPEITEAVLKKCSNSHAVALYNYLLKYHNFDRDNFPEGSALDYWNKTFR